MNKVTNGASETNLNLAGKSVSDAVAACSQVLDIDPKASILVNGLADVSDEYVIKDSDSIEFIK